MSCMVVLVCIGLGQYSAIMHAETRRENAIQLRIAMDEAAPVRAFAVSVSCDFSPMETGDAHSGIPLIEHFRLLQRLSIKGRDESWHLSLRPLTLGTTDFVVETMQGADDLEDAMKRIARAYNVIHGGAYNRVERRRDRLIYLIDDHTFPYTVDPGSAVCHALIEGVLIFLHAMLSLATGAGLSDCLRLVRSRRPIRRAPDGLLAFWNVPVRCNASAYMLEYDLAAATRPVRKDVVAVARVADVYEAVASMIVARENSVPRTDFPARVADAIASGAIEQPQVARLLGVSTATLRRRLGEASLTFRDVRVRVLNESARLLLEQRLHISDVAETLGFADGRSFSRAFKSWNGVTPAAFVALL